MVNTSNRLDTTFRYVVLTGLFVVTLFSFSLFSMTPAANANSPAGCPGGGLICAGDGGNAPQPGPTPPPGVPSPGVPNPGGQPNPGHPGDGGSGGYPVTRTWEAGSGSCAIRANGGAEKSQSALGRYVFHSTERRTMSGPNNRPEGDGWVKIFHYVGDGTPDSVPGSVWERQVFVGQECIYPPATYMTIERCYLSTTVNLYMTEPSNRLYSTKTSNSNYSLGSSDLNACINSRAYASIQSGLNSYGFYKINSSHRMANVNVEVALEAHPLTGVWPAPKIISTASVYTTGEKTLATASLHCRHGFQNPGVRHGDWTDASCINFSYFCPKINPQIEVSDIGATKKMRSFSDKIQLVRDGKTRELIFGSANVTGTNVSVSSYKTRFVRSGSPWDNTKSYSKNLFELSTSSSAKGSSLSVSSGGATNWINGKINSVFTRGYYASDATPTTLTQEIKWTGTRSIRSGVIASVNPDTGGITYTHRYINVPTSGTCSQTVSLDYVRAVGHENG